MPGEGYVADVIADVVGVSIADARVAQEMLLVVGHADLTNAVNGSPQAINLGAVLPTGARVFASSVVLDTPFSGGSVSECKLEVGGTDADAIVDALELITDQPTAAEKDAAAGVLPQGLYESQQLKATFTPDAGHALVALTAGQVTIRVWYFIKG